MEGLTKTGSANQSAREARRRCYRKHLPGLICQYPGHSENKSSWVPKTRGHPTSYAELTTAEREFTCDLGWCSRNSRSRRFLVLGEHFFSVFERMKVRLRSLDAPDSAMKLVLESKFPILRHYWPFSAHSEGVASSRASLRILVRRLERRSRRRREDPSGSARRNISSTC